MQALILDLGLEIAIAAVLIFTGFAKRHWKLLLAVGILLFVWGVYAVKDLPVKIASGILAALSIVPLGVGLWFRLAIVAAGIIISNFVHGFLGSGADFLTNWLPRNPNATGLKADLTPAQ